MKEAQEQDSRQGPDRRQQPTSPWSVFGLRGRRMHQRRAEQQLQPYYVDRFPASTFALILILLAATILDGLFTLQLLDAGCEEINPLMNRLLHIGMVPFLLGKYILTAAGLPLLLIFKSHRLFRTRFLVGYLLPVFVMLYIALLVYQIILFR